MGYTGHRKTQPRSILVILGGLLAWAGMVGGVLVATPQYHFAMTMKERPTEMSWHQLVEDGLTDNCHIRLAGVALESSEPQGVFGEMLQLDPDAPPEEQQAFFERLAEEADPGEMFAEATRPLKVYPIGTDPNEFEAKIVVPRHGWAMEAALAEIEESGTLTGRFTRSEGADFATKLTETLLAASQAQVDDRADGEAADENAGAPEDLAVEAGPAAVEPQQTYYVYEPATHVMPLAEAQQWFLLSVLAVAVGLVVCGSGGPSIICFFFFQGPSILSLLGYPLRYGRGSRGSRMLYVMVGLGLMAYGYDVMFVRGGFGQVHGEAVLCALGFLPCTFGIAAVLGAATNLGMSKLNLCLDPKTTKKHAEPKISMSDACSLDPVEADQAVCFEDRYLMPGTEPLEGELAEAAGSLTAMGFEQPIQCVHQDGLETRSVAIQLGCQEMVASDIEWDGQRLMTRLVSVLQDGITIITLSSGFGLEKESRFGTAGVYVDGGSDDPVAMLSAHLEQTVTMAEKRGTTVVTLEESELQDVTQFGRRVLADIRSQYGEENVAVHAQSYGRFHFPTRPVPTLSLV